MKSGDYFLETTGLGDIIMLCGVVNARGEWSVLIMNDNWGNNRTGLMTTETIQNFYKPCTIETVRRKIKNFPD